MKTSYKVLSEFLGITALLAAFVMPLFVVVTSPLSESTATVKFNLRQIVDLISHRDFNRFINNLFTNSDYSDFCPIFLTAFIFFLLSVICALMVCIFSLTRKKYVYNIACSGAGLIFLLISSLAVSGISYQASVGDNGLGNNLLDIFDEFFNLQSVICGAAYFFMGMCFIVIFAISGSLAIISRQSAKENSNP